MLLTIVALALLLGIFWVAKLLLFNRLFRIELDEFDEHLAHEEEHLTHEDEEASTPIAPH